MQRAFTLVELAIVLAVISIVAAYITPDFIELARTGMAERAAADLLHLQDGARWFYHESPGASGDPGRPYQAAASLGPGPIVIDTRKVNLAPDWLLVISLAGVWPSVFVDYRGVIGADGTARAAVHIPDVRALFGLEIHTAFVTLEAGAPSGVRAISNTTSFKIGRP